MKNYDHRVVLSLLVIVGFFAVLAAWLILRPEPSPELSLFMGALISVTSTVIGFYFGSSDGSKQKTDALINAGQAAPTVVVEDNAAGNVNVDRRP